MILHIIQYYPLQQLLCSLLAQVILLGCTWLYHSHLQLPEVSTDGLLGLVQRRQRSQSRNVFACITVMIIKGINDLMHVEMIVSSRSDVQSAQCGLENKLLQASSYVISNFKSVTSTQGVHTRAHRSDVCTMYDAL